MPRKHTQITPGVKTCLHCGEIMSKPKGASVRSWSKTKFCSDKCRKQSNKTGSKRCAQCGTTFFRKGQDGGRWHNRIYCSRQCYYDAKKKSVEDYISANSVESATGCFVWGGAFCDDGYPKVGSRYFGTERFVRAVFDKFHRKLGRDEFVTQTCGNKRCVNPDHLVAIPTLKAVATAKGSPPIGFRKNMSVQTKLRALLHNGNKCAKCGERVEEIERCHFDHHPPIQQRVWNDETQDTEPACSDYRYIFVMHDDCHRQKTKIDVKEIAKTKRLAADHEDFRRKILSRECGEKRQKTGKIRSRGFGK